MQNKGRLKETTGKKIFFVAKGSPGAVFRGSVVSL
jgi:hypothetical protein